MVVVVIMFNVVVVSGRAVRLFGHVDVEVCFFGCKKAFKNVHCMLLMKKGVVLHLPFSRRTLQWSLWQVVLWQVKSPALAVSIVRDNLPHFLDWGLIDRFLWSWSKKRLRRKADVGRLRGGWYLCTFPRIPARIASILLRQKIGGFFSVGEGGHCDPHLVIAKSE